MGDFVSRYMDLLSEDNLLYSRYLCLLQKIFFIVGFLTRPVQKNIFIERRRKVMAKRSSLWLILALAFTLAFYPERCQGFDFTSGEEAQPSEIADDGGIPLPEVPYEEPAPQEVPVEQPIEQPVEQLVDQAPMDFGFTAEVPAEQQQTVTDTEPQGVIQPPAEQQPQQVVVQQEVPVQQPIQQPVQQPAQQQVVVEVPTPYPTATPSPTPSPVPVTTTETTTEATTELPEEKSSLSEAEIQAMNDNKAVLSYEGDQLVFVGGNLAYGPVLDEEAAKNTVLRVKDLLGMDSQTSLLYKDVRRDVLGNVTWRFSQMLDTIPVEDGEVLVFTDEAGKVTGLSSSLASSFAAGEAGATREEVEHKVLIKLRKEGDTSAVLSDYTKQMLLANPAEAPYGDEHMLWVVYSENPLMDSEGGSPYVAHFLNGEGEYLYGIPASLPGEPSELEYYDTDEFFAGYTMLEESWNLYDRAGNEIDVSVPMLYNPVKEEYALGDPGRRMAVAEYVKNPGEDEEKFQLVTVMDRDGFAAMDLLTYQAFLDAFDFFEGITGMTDDSDDTGILLLKDYEDSQGEVLPGVSYLGFLEGWQLFSYNSVDGYSSALDLTGGTYAECILSSWNPALVNVNGPGRIREALMDIFGNLMEQMKDTHVDADWEVGETTGSVLRCLSNPNAYLRPSFTGDAFFIPETKRPMALTRYGGVEEDSSLLSLVAFLGCEAGMSPQEARALWGKVAMSLTAKTGEATLTEIIPWAAAQLGLSSYEETLRNAISSVRLGAKVYQPTRAKEGYSLVTFTPSYASVFLGNPVILSLQGADETLDGINLESWSTEGGEVCFMAPPGKYGIFLWIPDTASEGLLCYSYDGEEWSLYEEGSKAPLVSVPEGEPFALETEGLEDVDEAMAEVRLDLLLAVEDEYESYEDADVVLEGDGEA